MSLDKERLVRPTLLVPLVAATLLASCTKLAGGAGGHDYILTGARPDRLLVLDPVTRAVQSDFHIPEANGVIGAIVPSPDGRIAYVLVNRMESVAGIDLATGRQVFRADLSSPGERVKSMFAMDVTPDGRELIVHELPTRLERNEYRVEEPRFAVYSTSAGLNAKPVRQFAAPRRIHLILMKRDGRSFYAIGFELYEYDLQTGGLIAQRGIRSWELPNHSSPDMLAVWPVSEPSGIFVSPVYTEVQEPGSAQSPVARTALMSLDLRTGKLEYQDFEDTAALIFSTVMSPVRPEAFGVYSQLTKIDTAHHKLAQRIKLAHTYYSVNISTDGSEVYAGGAMCDVAIYDAATLKKKGDIRLPGCPDQVLSSLRVIHR